MKDGGGRLLLLLLLRWEYQPRFLIFLRLTSRLSVLLLCPVSREGTCGGSGCSFLPATSSDSKSN